MENYREKVISNYCIIKCKYMSSKNNIKYCSKYNEYLKEPKYGSWTDVYKYDKCTYDINEYLFC